MLECPAPTPGQLVIRVDAEAFLALVPRVPVRTHTAIFPLAAANVALDRLRAGELEGASVIVP
jgi:alcohol dehydrogenase, propanol-preferring